MSEYTKVKAALTTAVVMVALFLGACAGLHVPLKPNVQWVPFRATAVVVAKAWIPAHDEAHALAGDNVVVEHVPERWWVMVDTKYGQMRLLVGWLTYVFADRFDRMVVVGSVSDEPRPQLKVDHVERVSDPDGPREPNNDALKKVGTCR